MPTIHLYYVLNQVDCVIERFYTKISSIIVRKGVLSLARFIMLIRLADYEKWIANRGKLNAKNKSAQGE